MKKIFIYMMISACFAGMYGCIDLEEEPVGLLAPEGFFKAKSDVEAGIEALREVLTGDDIEAISSKSAELSQVMMKMGEAAYQAETDDEADGSVDPKADDETVVDAEFEEVDAEADNSKKASN